MIGRGGSQAGLKMYNVTLREGDAVFIHTGWEDLFLQYPAMNAVYNASEPGIGKDAGDWLAEQKVVLVGADNWAVEVIPREDPTDAFPVHVNLLANNGIHIIENVRTDLIAAEAQKTGRATFFLNMTVPKAVGSPATSSTSRRSADPRTSIRRHRRPVWGAGIFLPALSLAPAIAPGAGITAARSSASPSPISTTPRMCGSRVWASPATTSAAVLNSPRGPCRSRSSIMTMPAIGNRGGQRDRAITKGRPADRVTMAEADANPEIARKAADAGIRVLAINYPVGDAPLRHAPTIWPPDGSRARALADFAKQNWPDDNPLAAIWAMLGDPATPSRSASRESPRLCRPGFPGGRT